MTVFGLLLAAGRGRRFDPAGRRSKLEALIEGEAVAVRGLRRLAAGCDQVVALGRRGNRLILGGADPAYRIG